VCVRVRPSELPLVYQGIATYMVVLHRGLDARAAPGTAVMASKAYRLSLTNALVLGPQKHHDPRPRQWSQCPKARGSSGPWLRDSRACVCPVLKYT
jgi:hypothetical protein